MTQPNAAVKPGHTRLDQMSFGSIASILTYRLPECYSKRWDAVVEQLKAIERWPEGAPGEFIRKFLIHVLPQGFHRIRHYGLLASGMRADNIARERRLLDVSAAQPEATDTSFAEADEPKPLAQPWEPSSRPWQHHRYSDE